MVQGSEPITEYDERLLQGVFARIWRYLGEMNQREIPVSTTLEPEKLRSELDLAVGHVGVDVEILLKDIDLYLEHSTKTSHPHFMNPFWGGTSVPALAGEFITALTNTSMYTYEMAPVATLIESEMVQTMVKTAGFEVGEGTFTSGGSNGNMLGLLCGRDKKIPDANRTGVGDSGLVAFVSADSHYSVEMAANVLGIGMDNLIAVDCDSEGRMDCVRLQEAIAAERRAGKLPFCVVATSGTTVRGSFDPLNEIADICHNESLWLHVDGAWGGAALLSPKTRQLMSGIERADSFCWDPHKMMGMPISCSLFLVRDKGTLRKVCAHGGSAHYLLHDSAADYDLGRMSLQCARQVSALKLWLAWRAIGNEGWAKMVERYMDLAQMMTEQIAEHSQLQLVGTPQFTNVCLRYTGFGLSEPMVDSVTAKIRDQMIAEGRFMITKAMIDDRPVLRPVIANPAVDEHSIRDLIVEIVALGSRLTT